MRLLAFVLALAAAMPAPPAAAQAVRDVREIVRKAQALHILVPAESTARALHEQIVAAPAAERVALFQRLAREHSMDYLSGPRGGDLGMVLDGQFVDVVEDVMFRTRPGEVTPPIPSPLGWHLVYVKSFHHEPVAPFCEKSFQQAIDKAAEPQKSLLQMGQRVRDRAQLVLEVSTILGSGWSEPLQDADGNLVYFSTGPSPDPKLRLAQRHTDYFYPWVKVMPQIDGCVRSRRELWVVDCEGRRAGISSVTDYEGRGAAGQRLEHVQQNRFDELAVNFRPVAQGSLGAQMFSQACGPQAAAGLLPPYSVRARAFLRPFIDVPPGLAGNPEAEVEIRTLRDGTIAQYQLLRPSGVEAWDKAVLQGLAKAGRVPPEQDGKPPPRLVLGVRPRE